MEADLFAGIRVRDLQVARAWYERLLGGEPSFLPNASEAVWEVGEHRFVYILEDPERAGGSLTTFFTEDLDPVVDGIAARGIDPADRQTYDNGVRKVTYRDPDGNEIGYAGPPEPAG